MTTPQVCISLTKNASYLCSTVINQLHRPTTLILNPNKYSSICITCGQFLEGLVPSHQNHLKCIDGKGMMNTELAAVMMLQTVLYIHGIYMLKVQ